MKNSLEGNAPQALTHEKVKPWKMAPNFLIICGNTDTLATIDCIRFYFATIFYNFLHYCRKLHFAIEQITPKLPFFPIGAVR